ncbi:hypothetical protein CYMTET_8682 [Cymbomonas tetramitiformis]|uniref:proton-translocating NAD(P)(+) transhydrogenase n=1 Tax=Cymbomonas tetramitiformis TaxID=36881 RepID=A0AAE0GT07_9CHLO|nr:hypothetical protein CYMTET_8682 [Cymbomonas tetramitiformis]
MESQPAVALGVLPLTPGDWAGRCFDVRPVCEEQVKALGGEFLKVPGFENYDGSGAGGYAKEIGDDFLKAEMQMFKDQCAECDVVVTTALIPNRPAPKLILAEAVAVMKTGSVIVDLAAENGGNVEGCKPGETYTNENGVTIIGKFPMQNEMPNQASSLFSNNCSNFLKSMGDKETFFLNPADEAVRGTWLLDDGVELERYIPVLAPPPPPKEPAEEVEKEPEMSDETKNLIKVFTQCVIWAVPAIALAFASKGVDLGNLGMLTTFALACLAGAAAVKGVQSALHSPLMSLTNAISGLTIVGGLFVFQDMASFATAAWWKWLGPVAVFVSALNIGGGFTMTGRMIGMFKRKTDAPKYTEVYSVIMAAVLAGGFWYAQAAFVGSAFLISSIACLTGISCLANQDTAPFGQALGTLGVGGAVAATFFSIPSVVITQALATAAAGGLLGYIISVRSEVTDLPQLVAAFHSLVGLAATATALADFMAHSSMTGLGHLASVYVAACIGALTITGSLVAFGKLQGLLSGAAMKIPLQNPINAGIVAVTGFFLAKFFMAPAITPLLVGTGLFALLGYLVASQVGGGDMPVVITLLNSASGWALCAEGFALGNALLVIVGSLIGASGAMLSLEMCEAMNVSVAQVLKITSKVKPGAGGDGEICEIDGDCTETLVESVAEHLCAAKKVMIVPGYGLAVAKGQYALSETVKFLKAGGADVKIMIHPVAGRLPGQLNVLLAESGIDYDDVLDMEENNEPEDWEDIDLALVVGANDTVNPLAETEPNCEIYGMPVIRCWLAKEVVMLKRSLGAGYAALPNPLMYNENSLMLLGDAKCNLEYMRDEVRTKMSDTCLIDL